MGKITLAEAAGWCGGRIDPKYADVTFEGANNDSRSVLPGQLFLALRGARDGHDFIPMALEKGAAAALCTHCEEDIPAIVVPDPRTALGDIARHYREKLGVRVVGVTGSVGKSTTKEMIACVLERKYRVAKTPVNHNNDIGMPMAILDMPEDTQVAVLEMGMNHFREIAYLAGIARPNIAVITNIGTMHIEHLGSQAGILEAKLEILEGMNNGGRIILNGDDRLLWNVRQKTVPVTFFGVENDQADVRALNVREEDNSIRFEARSAGVSMPIVLAIEGTHFVPDALAAISVGLELGVPPEDIRQSLEQFRNMEGRQEILREKGFTIIKDCYNAGPESMNAALNVLGKREGRKIAVLGDMLELGSCTQAEHYLIGRIAAEKVDVLLAYGENAPRVVSGAVTGGMPYSKALSFTDRDALVKELKRIAKPGDVMLFKGSHGMHMELALEKFLKDQD